MKFSTPQRIATLLGLTAPVLLPCAHGALQVAQTLLAGDALTSSTPLWPDARVQGLMLNSFGLAGASALLATTLACLCAMAWVLPLARRWQHLLAALMAASFCLGTVVHLMAWRVVFPGVSGGWQGWLLATLALGVRYLPLATAVLVAGLATPERSELEAALLLGGPGAAWRVARGRLLRLAAMALAVVATLVLCEPELPALLGVNVYAQEFLSQVALEPSSSASVALGWPLMASALLCAALLALAPQVRAGVHSVTRSGWLGGIVQAGTRLRWYTASWALAWASAPLLLLAFGCWSASGRWPAHAGMAVFNSLWVAAASATLACAWGWCLSESAVRAGAWASRALNGALLLGMLWPSVLTGIALAGSTWPDALSPSAPLVLAHTLRALPFATWIFLALRHARAPAALEQLALLGPPTAAAWWHIHGPATLPGLRLAFALSVGLSLAELTTTVLTVPPGMETVILRLYNLLHYGDQQAVAMLALVQATSVAGLMMLALGWHRKSTC